MEIEKKRLFLIWKESHRYAILLTGILLLAFLTDNLIFGPWVGGFVGNYMLPAFMWSFVIGFVFWLPRVKYAGKIRLRRLACWLAMVCVLIMILAMFIQGGIGGFGNSPYDRSVMGILINLVSLSAMIGAMEMSRAWMLNRCFLRRPLAGIALISLFFTILSIPLNKWSGLQGGLATTKFIGMTLFPEIAQNVLVTYLAFLGGPVPAILYQLGIIMAERLSPVLPNMNWVSQTLFGTLAPVIGFILVQQIYREEARLVRGQSRDGQEFGWVMTALASILILWFSMGVFSYAPRVVVSGSMAPTMKIGDVVIIKTIPGEEARIGDIIMFPLNNMKVTHRVVKVQEQEGKKKFVTKGDANREEDQSPVALQAVKGKVVLVIPKVGYPTIFMRNIR